MERPGTPTWWLGDGEQLSAEAPRTFFIPPIEHRANLDIGRTAKLLFQCTPRDVGGAVYDGERMWVEVTSKRTDGSYTGRLANTPGIVTELAYGDEVEFERQHVIAIEYTDDELGYAPGAPAVVDARVIREDAAPAWVLHALPPGGKQSVWFAGLDTKPPEDRQNVTLGYLTDKWPELALPFSAGAGRWVRAEGSESYRREA
jgi:hypothetical protein